jgi:hypothetical protein
MQQFNKKWIRIEWLFKKPNHEQRHLIKEMKQ